MSKARALDLATGLGGKIEKQEVLSAVDKYSLTLSLSLSLPGFIIDMQIDTTTYKVNLDWLWSSVSVFSD